MTTAMDSLLLPLASPTATLSTVGGKGVNLARMALAGLPVPAGFLIPTAAYDQFVVENHLDTVILPTLARHQVDDTTALEAASAQIRAAFADGVVAPTLLAALAAAYQALGEPPVAVRSSATAEDLPELSFAGQQDTFLNVQGHDALVAAMVRCWSSLWTARAIAYRARVGLPQDQVALAVVVQVMAPATAAGVLFTANPLNGLRTQTVIDATLGLGEALVSGQVEPDHYVVETATGAILHKSLGAKATMIVSRAGGGLVTQAVNAGDRQALPDGAIVALTRLSQQVAALYDLPQDIEWAWADDQLYLLQARPITSLFPLPAGMAAEPLRVLAAFAAVQGIVEPLTPLGQDTLKLVLTGAGSVFKVDTDLARQRTIYSAAERLYIDVSPLLRNPLGRKIFPRLVIAIDPGVAQAIQSLVADPRLAPQGHRFNPHLIRRIAPFAAATVRRIWRTWRDPEEVRLRVTALLDAEVAATATKLTPTGDLWVDLERQTAQIRAARDLLAGLVLPEALPLVMAGMIPFFGILQRFADEAAKASEQPAVAQLPLTIARSLPHNVTTEMDLALWQTAQRLHADPVAAAAFEATTAADLVADYLAGALPAVAQAAVASFMAQYGMRGLGEIDLGRPRWREQPEHIIQVLQSYLSIQGAEQAPDAVFGRGVQAAADAVARLEAAVRATRGGFVKARLVRWASSRYHAVAGMREAPKFFAIRMMGLIRAGLLHSGAQLAAAGWLDRPDDLFFLYLPELEALAARRTVGPELKAAIVERRALRVRELRRRQLPRVLLSDGAAYYEGMQALDGNAEVIVGDPVSPGVAEGVVHVVFDPSGTQLAPGEILVCPGTDPAWTPLFLTAGALVMEVGGMMTHGSVVAREYGIPAVVGVTQATTRLKTGQRVRVDGATGVVSVIQDHN